MLTSADTAYTVAHMRALESRRPPSERLFEDPYASLFADAGQHALEATQRLLELPFMLDAVRLRTRAHDDRVRDALAAGAAQVVLLGAGFDVRGLRMPEIPARGVRVYEVDFPHQLENKRSILAAGGVALPPWVTHVGCDLAAPGYEDALAEALEAGGFRKGGSTHVIMEGITPYIDAATFERSLRFVARTSGRGSTVTFEIGAGYFDPVPADERMRRAGLTRWEAVGFDALWRRYLPGEPHPNSAIFSIGTATV
jgi:methyltransferase (TIGR00027 family)